MTVRRFLLLALVAVVAVACADVKTEPADVRDPAKQHLENSGKLFGDITFGGGDTRDPESGGPSGIGVNGFLWRASLDTLAFLPLTSADPFGGVIITDWYAPPESPKERFKVTVYLLGRQLRSDGLRVSVFRQTQRTDGGWVDAALSDNTATKLADAILTRARELRIASNPG